MPFLSPPPPQRPRTFRQQHHNNKTTSKQQPCIIRNFLNLTSKGQYQQAIQALPYLSRKGFRLNSKVLAFLIQQCANARSIKDGKRVHLHLNIAGPNPRKNTFLSNHLIHMYAKCGDHVKAREVFDKMRVRNLHSWNVMLSGYGNLGMVKAARKLFGKMPERDVVSWNTMIMAYTAEEQYDNALSRYKELRRLDIGFNEYTFAGLLMVCVKLRESRLVEQVHCQVLVVGFLSNVVLSSSVIDAYTKCGKMGDAKRLFDEAGKRDLFAWTTLVSGYARWADMELARKIFDSMPGKSTVSWNALISGYAKNGMGREALKLFRAMVLLRVELDQVTFSSGLLACASIDSIENGRQIHSNLITRGIRPNVVVASSLIDMYSKCGDLENGKRVFDSTENKQDIALWNAMFSALAYHGFGERAVNLAKDMDTNPDRLTFLILLGACSNSGLVQDGLSLFASMVDEYRIYPDEEHYARLILLLGRARCFDELMDQMKKMRIRPGDCVWNTLLGTCRVYGNGELEKIARKCLGEVEPRSDLAYLLLASVYAVLGRWEFVEEVRQFMNCRDENGDRAFSWLEIDQNLHENSVSNELGSSGEES